MLFLRLVFILIISTFANLAFAKPLPPGSGNSIPANILFLVDKSNSMFQPADGEDSKGSSYMKGAPVDVAGNFNGNYFAAMIANMGINYWNPFTDRWVTNGGTFKNQGISLSDKMYEADYIKGVDGYGSYLYAVIDRSHTNRSSISGQK